MASLRLIKNGFSKAKNGLSKAKASLMASPCFPKIGFSTCNLDRYRVAINNNFLLITAPLFKEMAITFRLHFCRNTLYSVKTIRLLALNLCGVFCSHQPSEPSNFYSQEPSEKHFL